MLKLPQDHQAIIYKGFISEIQKKHPNSYLESTVLKNFNQPNKQNNYLFPERKDQGS